MSGGRQIPVRVVECEAVTPTVKRVRMAPREGAALPPYSAGSHTVVTLRTPERTIRNAYSLLASTREGGHYEIAVLRVPQSRGGSAFVHDHLHPGTELTISLPVNLFPLSKRGRKHILVAGGIGITPVAAMAEELAALNLPFELHYAMRSEATGAFAGALVRRFGTKVRLYVDERQEVFRVGDILPNQPIGSHLYVCGPGGMIESVLADARAAGWPEASLHAERFLAPAGGEPFALRLARSGITTTVGEHETILEAMERETIDAPYLCRGGACGQCRLEVVAKDGELIHRDHFLTDGEKATGGSIMTCVSRLKGRELVLNI